MKTITFTGTALEVQHKAAEWKAANRTTRVLHETAPFAVGEKVDLLVEPVWTVTIEYDPA